MNFLNNLIIGNGEPTGRPVSLPQGLPHVTLPKVGGFFDFLHKAGSIKEKMEYDRRQAYHNVLIIYDYHSINLLNYYFSDLRIDQLTIHCDYGNCQTDSSVPSLIAGRSAHITLLSQFKFFMTKFNLPTPESRQDFEKLVMISNLNVNQL